MTFPSVLRTAAKQERRRPQTLYHTLLYTSWSASDLVWDFTWPFSALSYKPVPQTHQPQTTKQTSARVC